MGALILNGVHGSFDINQQDLSAGKRNGFFAEIRYFTDFHAGIHALPLISTYSYANLPEKRRYRQLLLFPATKEHVIKSASLPKK